MKNPSKEHTQHEELQHLRGAVQLYEAALKAAFPGGAQGRVLDYWNSARILLNGIVK